MAGIMTPIAGENKSRTCYFYDSGPSLLPMRRLLTGEQQLTVLLRGLYAPVQILATTVRTRSTEQLLSAPALHIDRCSFPRCCRRPHHTRPDLAYPLRTRAVHPQTMDRRIP